MEHLIFTLHIFHRVYISGHAMVSIKPQQSLNGMEFSTRDRDNDRNLLPGQRSTGASGRGGVGGSGTVHKFMLMACTEVSYICHLETEFL